MIRSISIHTVGNKSSDESLRLSKQEALLNDTLQGALSQYFLSAFKPEENILRTRGMMVRDRWMIVSGSCLY